MKPNNQNANEKECPACGGNNPIHNKFCKYCGLELIIIEPVMPKVSELVKRDTGSILKKSKMSDDERECPECGAFVKKTVNFCSSCGKVIGPASISQARVALKSTKEITPKKKDKVIEEVATKEIITEKEKKEIEKTESEMDIEKKVVLCVVHRGPIVGSIYLCPECMTYYCLKCAKALKENDESCWSCGKEIEIAVSEEEIKQRVQDYEVRLESLKTTVKNLDDSFFTGAISKDEYKKMKDPLTEKIEVLLREIKTYKS